MSSVDARRRKTTKKADRLAEPPDTTVKPEEKPPKYSNAVLRTVTTVLMIGAFLYLTYVGQTPAAVLVLVLQISMFREIIGMSVHYRRERQIPGFGLLPWFFLTVALMYLYLRAMRRPLLRTWPNLQETLARHSFVCFLLYVTGFMLFVSSLKRKVLAYQFSQFAWSHMTILYIVCQGAFFINNMFEGMFWFLFPVSLIVGNDVLAYMCGKAFGRTRLLKLSPKKTYEGFIGAALFTYCWAFYFSWQLAQFQRMTCPKHEFFSVPDCEVPAIFMPRDYRLPDLVRNAVGAVGFDREFITVLPIQWHSLAFATFASLAAPFGGFFGSGLKRAFKIKDFGDLIPGHGGVTDRMDCQLLMATFTFVWITNFVRPSGGFCTGYRLVAHCVKRMSTTEQIRLYNTLVTGLMAKGVQIFANGTASMP